MRVILIAGPTASGKSSAAIGVAEQCGGVIVNADSMQVYKELDILSSRPSREDEARVEHRLYGYLPASEACSVARWLDDVKAVIDDVAACGKVPVIVGGTGLYFRAMEFGLSPVPHIDPPIRQTIRERLESHGAPALHAQLAELDREAALGLKENDSQRIARALEVLEATGKPLAWWHKKASGEAVLADCDIITRIALAPPREQLYQRINARFDDMVSQGGVREVEHLLAMKLEPSLPAMKAIGVRALAGYLQGEASLENAIDKVKQETRNYAKRQMTWQRNQMSDWPVFENADAVVNGVGKQVGN